MSNYLFITNRNTSTCKLETNFSDPIQYTLDNGLTWNTLEANASLEIPGGLTARFKATKTPSTARTDTSTAIATNWFGIGDNSNLKIGGEIMSLLHEDNTSDMTPVLTGGPNNEYYTFIGAFSSIPESCTIDFSELILPTILVPFYFADMFSWSPLSNSIPKNLLPSLTLAKGCYKGMFFNCTGIKTAPELPAKNLAESCYQEMFHSSDLENAPDLPAKDLAFCCYAQMFARTGITKLKVKAKTWDEENYPTIEWVDNVTSEEGIFYCPSELPQTFDADHIPNGWQVKSIDKQSASVTFLNQVKIGGRVI